MNDSDQQSTQFTNATTGLGYDVGGDADLTNIAKKNNVNGVTYDACIIEFGTYCVYVIHNICCVFCISTFDMISDKLFDNLTLYESIHIFTVPRIQM